MSEAVPTLYDWAGGGAAFERLTELFYAKVREDDLLEPVFRGMDADHPKHVAAWLAEVFGGRRRTPTSTAAIRTCLPSTAAWPSPKTSAVAG